MSFRDKREQAGRTVLEVSRILEISPAAVYQWEAGETRPRTSFLPTLAKLYDCTVDELLAENHGV